MYQQAIHTAHDTIVSKRNSINKFILASRKNQAQKVAAAREAANSLSVIKSSSHPKNYLVMRIIYAIAYNFETKKGEIVVLTSDD